MLSISAKTQPLHRALASLAASLALVMLLLAPSPAQARSHGIGGLIVGAAAAVVVVCSLDPSKCRNGGRGGGRGGPADAIALSAQAKMDIQSGLANIGFYNGAIDGLFGAGTRNSIRQYQSAIGENATGMLTGKQINDLIALAPRYAQLPADDPRLFETTIAGDVNRDQMRMIQSALNQRGYNAGPVDGTWGRRTSGAVQAYMRDNFLPGPTLPSRRLLAHLQGTPAPEPAGAYLARVAPPMASMGQTMPQGTAQTGLGGIAIRPVVPATVAQAPVAKPPVPAGEQPGFDLLGVHTGMSQSDVLFTLEQEMTEGLTSEFMLSPEQFNGDDVLNMAIATNPVNWPEPGSEQILSVFDDSAPEAGALAIFRTIILPDTVTQATFDSQILPDLLAKYGTESRVGDGLIWIGDGNARQAIASGAMSPKACGSLGLDLPLPSASGGTNVALTPAGLADIQSNCGDVLRVHYTQGALHIGLWNSDAILARRAAHGGGTAPRIKF